MNKKDLSEADIKAKFITPALLKAGWDEQTQIGREVYFTKALTMLKGNINNIFLSRQFGDIKTITVDNC
jgi:type I restriction enzyme R subunit